MAIVTKGNSHYPSSYSNQQLKDIIISLQEYRNIAEAFNVGMTLDKLISPIAQELKTRMYNELMSQ